MSAMIDGALAQTSRDSRESYLRPALLLLSTCTAEYDLPMFGIASDARGPASGAKVCSGVLAPTYRTVVPARGPTLDSCIYNRAGAGLRACSSALTYARLY